MEADVHPSDPIEGEATLSPQTKEAVRFASYEMQHTGHHYLDSAHLLLGIMDLEGVVASFS